MTELVLGDGFAIDANVATRRTFLFGQPDSGKTNALTVICEGLLKIGVPVTVLDWKGDIWGLRSSADGERPGYPVVIFGGEHADVDVREEDGREIGTVVAREHMPSIIDLSMFPSDAARRRFYTAFVRAFLNAKAPREMQTPHLLAIDEAQQFAPQNPYGDGVALLGAIEAISGLGRKRGIGVLATAVRAAVVNKNLTELCDLYLFMQVAGKNDLKSIAETIGRYGTDDVAALTKALPRLGKGEVVAYSPAWLRILEQRKFRVRETFDSSATPEVGVAIAAGPRSFATVDVPALSARIEATREARDAEDPVALRARIKELEQRVGERADLDAIKTHQDAVAAMQRRAEAAERDMEVLQQERDAARRERDQVVSIALSLRSAMSGVSKMLLAALEGLTLDIERINDTVAPVTPLEPNNHDAPTGPARANASAPVATAPTSSASRPADGSSESGTFRAGARRMVQACAQFPDRGLTKSQIVALAKVKAGGTFSTYLGEITRAAFVEQRGSRWFITKAGLNYLGGDIPTAPRTAKEIIERWRSEFRDGGRRMLDVIVSVHPRRISRSVLAERAEVKMGGTFSTYLGELKRSELVAEDSDGLFLAVAELWR